MNPKPSSEGPISTDLLEKNSALVLSIFQTVWTEFYTWEQAYCQQVINSLASSSQAYASHATEFSNTSSTLSDMDAFDLTQDSGGDYLDVLEYSEDSAPKSTKLAVETINVTPPFLPIPGYEICTPISTNIFTGDDSDYMPFIAFSDDPDFDHFTHTEEYSYFAWQGNDFDPDLQVIVIETARRLYIDHNVSYATIDETGILPLELVCQAQPSRPGLCHISWQRDLPKWPGAPQASPFPLPSSLIQEDPASNLASILTTFCNNLNCIHGYCTLHLEMFGLPAKQMPQIRSDELFNTVDTPCSKACFMFGNSASISSFWSEYDTQTLQTVLELTPDLSPCDLATMCRKPCQEVFAHRRRILPDGHIVKPERPLRTRLVRKHTLEYLDYDALVFTPKGPCHHDGPCDASANCRCFANKSHCEHGCRCSEKCQRRWTGCNCARTNRKRGACQTDRCRCYMAHRECDPKLCVKCDAKDITTNICQNSPMQQGRKKSTEVKQSDWGLGLFLTEPAEQGELIIEYVGELIFEPTTRSRDDVAAHRGRNYLFDLNPTLSIDSTYAGNESRFINHCSEGSNAEANVRLVNGDHRIGIYATSNIKAGSEILFDYGQDFFKGPVRDLT